ncbi:hypothetical protein H634G_09804 [Metarhizium anisopliae BRIP 53293]|uniref:Heat Labile Enterotoxin Type Iib n=1 Tax=Metarhizium anisopliae BRIP 53293 TaxID=1291518 RepID=A0A0D9NQS4_METAN|nr:hypothetical protein H634G_09804 [Metarhizium anisopliae BRIP 53293]KJK86339.1 hypothetical protein H633G_09816 [Metarhizium anisopliae BRIP 53284]
MTVLSIILYALVWSLNSRAISVLGVPANNDLTSGSLPQLDVGSQEAPSSLKTKRQSNSDILLALYYRDPLALWKKKLDSFHWGIHVSPENVPGKSTTLFHAVNEGEDLKVFEYEKRLVNPLTQKKLLGRIKIGTKPSTFSIEDIDHLLSQVPVPNKHDAATESCVSWALCGVRKLQEGGVIESFDTETFSDQVLQYGLEQFRATLYAETGAENEITHKIARYDVQQGKTVVEEVQGNQATPVENPENPEEAPVLCERSALDCMGRPAKEKTPNTADEGELVPVAKQSSKENFDSLLEEFGHDGLVKNDRLYTELNVRLGELSTLPRAERIAGFTKIGEGALGVAGLALYGKAVADVFTSDTSVMDKAVVLTSVLPGIGCAVQLAQGIQNVHVNAGHIALCFAEDALMLSGFWEIALVLQLSESLVEFFKEDAEQRKLFDTELFRQKGSEGWAHNVERMLSHIKSDEFAASAKTQFLSYQLLILYQASQLRGDFQASHQAISATVNASDSQPEHGTNVDAHVKFELNRQICAAMALAKRQLRQKLESVALKHTEKLSNDFKEQFFSEYRKAATRPISFLGIPMPQNSWNIAELDRVINEARAFPLPLYKDRIDHAIQEVMERLEMPDRCKCLQGSKKKVCEFADCSNPEPSRWHHDSAGRIYVKNILSQDIGVRTSLSENCTALFTPCQGPDSAGETGRQLWCRL